MTDIPYQADTPAKGSREWFAARGFDRPVGKLHANMWEQITFDWAAPMLKKGARGQIQEDTAEAFVDENNSALYQARTFEEAYEELKVGSCCRVSCSLPTAASVSSHVQAARWHVGLGLGFWAFEPCMQCICIPVHFHSDIAGTTCLQWPALFFTTCSRLTACTYRLVTCCTCRASTREDQRGAICWGGLWCACTGWRCSGTPSGSFWRSPSGEVAGRSARMLLQCQGTHTWTHSIRDPRP